MNETASRSALRPVGQATPTPAKDETVTVLSTPMPPHKVGQRPQVWSRIWFLVGLPLVLGATLLATGSSSALTVLRNGWPVLTLFAAAYTVAWALAAEFERFPTTQSGEALLFGATAALLPTGTALLTSSVYMPPYFMEAAGLGGAVWLAAGTWIFRQRTRSRFAVLPGGSAHDLLRSVGATHETSANGHDIPETVDGVVADLHQFPRNGFGQLLASNSLRGLPVFHAAYLYEMLTGRVLLDTTCTVSAEGRPPGQFYAPVKRTMDIMLVLASLPIIIPMGLVTACAIKLESPGPVFFTQERVGKNGQPFQMIKMRSMRTDAEKNGARFAGEDDARITRVGRFIRKFRIDELPQFWNVLKGEMSLIGPRPEQCTFAEQFRDEIHCYSQRHTVRPGITGWAQVRNGYAASMRETRQKLAYDLYYVKHRSLVLDLLILCLTVKTIFTGFGAR